MSNGFCLHGSVMTAEQAAAVETMKAMGPKKGKR
jgi:hypothetical protein